MTWRWMLRCLGQLQSRILRPFPGMRLHRCLWLIVCSQCIWRQFFSRPRRFSQCVPHWKTFPRVYAPETFPRFPTGSFRRASFGTRTPPRAQTSALLCPHGTRRHLCCTRHAPCPYSATAILQHRQKIFQLECLLFMRF